MSMMRNHTSTEILPVEPHDAYKFEGDFFGLLENLGVENQYHITVMRVNGITNPMQVDQDLTFLLMPPIALLDNVRQLYKTKMKKPMA